MKLWMAGVVLALACGLATTAEAANKVTLHGITAILLSSGSDDSIQSDWVVSYADDKMNTNVATLVGELGLDAEFAALVAYSAEHGSCSTPLDCFILSSDLPSTLSGYISEKFSYYYQNYNKRGEEEVLVQANGLQVWPRSGYNEIEQAIHVDLEVDVSFLGDSVVVDLIEYDSTSGNDLISSILMRADVGDGRQSGYAVNGHGKSIYSVSFTIEEGTGNSDTISRVLMCGTSQCLACGSAANCSDVLDEDGDNPDLRSCPVGYGETGLQRYSQVSEDTYLRRCAMSLGWNAFDSSVSLGKHAEVSHPTPQWIAARGVDGTVGSVSESEERSEPWWQVDLGLPLDIDHVQIDDDHPRSMQGGGDAHAFLSNTPFGDRTRVELLGDPSVAKYGFDLFHFIERQKISVGKTGRYLRIQRAGHGELRLEEVAVYGKNFARGRTPEQSSLGWGGVASRAVDGTRNGTWSSGSVMHTANDAGAWWQVDLGESIYVITVDVFSRTDCCLERMNGAKVFVSAQPFGGRKNLELSQDESIWESHPADGIYFNRFDVGVPGRYVRIGLLSPGFLSLAEVEVYGSTDTPEGPWAWTWAGMAQISAGPDGLFGVNSSNEVWRNRHGVWMRGNGAGVHIGAGPGGDLWVLGTAANAGANYPVYRKEAFSAAWTLHTGGLVAIAAGRNALWGPSSNGEVWRYQDQAWEKMPFNARAITVDPDDSVWFLDEPQLSDGNLTIYHASSDGSGKTKMTGGLVQLSAGPSSLWGVSANHEIWQYRDHQTWTQIPGSAVAVIVSASGEAYALSTETTEGGHKVMKWTGGN